MLTPRAPPPRTWQVALEYFNTTHTINTLSFGDRYLDGNGPSPSSSVLEGHHKIVQNSHVMHQVCTQFSNLDRNWSSLKACHAPLPRIVCTLCILKPSSGIRGQHVEGGGHPDEQHELVVASDLSRSSIQQACPPGMTTEGLRGDCLGGVLKCGMVHDTRPSFLFDRGTSMR